jgi:uncharacterized protein YeaC (DUF1315 family)
MKSIQFQQVIYSNKEREEEREKKKTLKQFYENQKANYLQSIIIFYNLQHRRNQTKLSISSHQNIIVANKSTRINTTIRQNIIIL